MSCLEKTQKLGRSRQRRGATNESPAPAPASVAHCLSGAPPHPDAHGLPPHSGGRIFNFLPLSSPALWIFFAVVVCHSLPRHTE